MMEAPRIEEEHGSAEWHRPTLTKLSLDETLFGGGSNIDGIDGQIAV